MDPVVAVRGFGSGQVWTAEGSEETSWGEGNSLTILADNQSLQRISSESASAGAQTVRGAIGVVRGVC